MDDEEWFEEEQIVYLTYSDMLLICMSLIDNQKLSGNQMTPKLRKLYTNLWNEVKPALDKRSGAQEKK